MLKIKRGNTVKLRYQIKINGEVVDNLADITRGVFCMKRHVEDADTDAVVFIEYLQGSPNPQFEVNVPYDGCITVTLYSSDTQNLNEGKYYYALQLEWGQDLKLEFKYGDGLIFIESDVIHS